MKIIYFVRSVPPYWSNRIDVDYIIKNLISKGDKVFIYDIKQRMLLNCNTNERKYFIKKNILFDSSKIYLLINFFVFFYFLKKFRDSFDVCQVLYVREEQLLLYGLMRKFTKKLILSFYGTDINRRNFIKNIFQKLIRDADAITVTNFFSLEKRGDFYGEIDKNKIHQIMFPQVRLCNYSNKDYSYKKTAKIKMGLDINKKVIVLGTNGSPNEQHVKVLRALIINKELVERIFLIIPLSYAGNSEYYSEIKNILYQNLKNNNYLLIERYLSEEEVLDMRFAADYLLNFRKWDQLASSIAESFMAYCEVISGSWLPYRYYDNEGLTIHYVDEIDSLSKKLVQLIYSEKERIEILQKNRELIETIMDVDKQLKDWHNFYKNLFV
jgi:hypothetical protein